MITGEAAFNARLNALKRTGTEVAHGWADAQVRNMRGAIRSRTGRTAASLHADEHPDGVNIMGSGVVNMLASGTRAHEERAHGQAMAFSVGGPTIFSKRVMHPPTAGNPKIKNVTDALDSMKDTAIELWNRAA